MDNGRTKPLDWYHLRAAVHALGVSAVAVAVLAASLAFSVPVVASAAPLVEATVAGCADPTVDPFASGSGTEADPYLVATAAQLRALSLTSTYDTCWFRQTASFSLAEYPRWVPIGSNSPNFRGVYDGGGYSITGLQVTGMSSGGLFSQLKTSGLAHTTAVRNVFVSGTVTVSGFAGGLVSNIDGAVEISNVHVDVDVTSTEKAAGGLAAGISTTRFIERSSALGDAVGFNDVGGFAGVVYAGTIRDSFSRGSVNATFTSGSFAGTVYSTSAVTIEDSYSTGAVLSGSANGFAGAGTKALTTTYWDTTTSGRTTSTTTAVGKTTSELQTLSTYGTNWSIASTWSTSNTWVLCSGVNGGYPALTGRYTSDPCTSAAVTVTAPSLSLTSDRGVAPIGYLSSPTLLPGDWGTAPACGIYDSTNTLVTGTPTAGTYTSRCSGAVYGLASGIEYIDGTVTVTSPAGGRMLLLGSGVENASDIYSAAPDGSGQRLLRASGYKFSEPKWSPNGEKIAFLDKVGFNNRVFVMDGDGSNVTPLGSPSADDRVIEFVWLDDQTVLAQFEQSGLYTLTLTGSATVTAGSSNLISSGTTLRQLSINPTGTAIAFVDTEVTNQCFDDFFGPYCYPVSSEQYAYTAPVTSGAIGTPTRVNDVPNVASSPAFTSDGGSLLYVTSNTTLVKQNLTTGVVTTLVDVGPEAIGDVAVDPVSGDAFYQRCSTDVCQLPTIQRLAVSGSGTSSLVVIGGYPSLKAIPAAPTATTTTTAVASASIVTGSTITATTTVTATPATSDPTGTVTVYYCYSATAAPTSCSDITGTKVNDLTLVAGTANDGIATATLSAWTPASGIGFYRFFATYGGDTTYPASTETGTAVGVAVDNVSACADPLVDPFAGGRGTQLFPYQIATAAQLRGLTWQYMSCQFKQTAHISLAAYPSWQPIGSGMGSGGFSGIYDGGGFSITGLRVNSRADRTGLFATIVRGSTAAGSISPTVKNLFIAGTVTGGSVAGGLVGQVTGGVTISNVHVDVDITGVTSVGGLIGYAQQSSTLSATVEYSSSYGSVTGSNAYIGGLVGRFEGGASTTPGVVQFSFARGAVSGPATTGGLVGRFDATSSTYRTNVINAYATGLVTKSSGTTTSFGGLVGGTSSTPTSTNPIFVVTRSFWDTTTTKQGTTASNKGTGLATLDMQTLSSYTDTSPWSIASTWSPSTSTWVLCSGLNGGYPALTARYGSDPCTAAAVTVAAQSLTLTSDVVAAAPSFVPTSSLRLPADFGSEPTCDIYDTSGSKVTGTALVPGTYASRCSGAVVPLATGSIQYVDGVVTVTGMTGGRLLLARSYGGRADILSAALDGSGELVVGASSVTDPLPVWSPNGQKIAYISNDSNGVAQVFVMDRNGSNATQVSTLTSTAEAQTIRWLNATQIVVNTDATAGNELGVITLGTTNSYAVVSSSGLSNGYPFSINPDGNRIAYSGLALSTTYALRLASFSTTSMGTPSAITPTGSATDGHSRSRHSPIFTADGTSLLYVNAVTADGITNRTKIVLRNLTSGAETVIWAAPGTQGITNLALEPVSGDLFFNYCQDQSSCGWVADLYRVKVEASATPTFVSSGVQVGSVAPVVKTRTTSTVRVGSALVAQGGSVSVTATVSAGWENIDPTGDVSFSYCYSASAMPASCTPTIGTAITPAVGLAVDTSIDGKATATLSFTPPDGLGYYRLAASYAGTTSFSGSTTTATATFAADGPPCADPSVDPFAGGSGTQIDPYRIATAAQLAAISSTYTTCSFVQTADISLAGYRRWTPIGSGSTAGFAGVYDGDGHIITDMRVEGALGGGLFSKLKEQSSAVVVRDLFISGAVSGGGNLGAVAGSTEGSVSVSNVHVDVDVTSPGDRVGGLVGIASGGLSIDNSSSSGQLSGRYYVGGLVGSGITMTITDSYARGSASGSGSVGGLAGYLTSSTITRAYSTAAVSGVGGLGGLVGQGFDLTVTDSFWDMDTSGQMTTDGGGTGRFSDDMTSGAFYTNWNVAQSWSEAGSAGTDWLICPNLNGGYPVVVSRYGSDPCALTAYTVTAPSFTIAADVPVPSISFLSSPLSLPSDWTTAPTCAIYSGSTPVTGKLTAGGTYTTQCSGGVHGSASSVAPTAGTVTVTAVGTGGRLLVALPSGEVADLALANLDGTNRLLIGSTNRANPNAEWSPDGTKIAYIDNVNGRPQVFVMDADGTDVVQMTDVASPVPVTLSWITNSALLVDTNAKVWILTGKDDYTELTGSPTSTVDVTVSPDGTRIAYVDETTSSGSGSCAFPPCAPSTPTTTYSLRTAPLTLLGGTYSAGTPTAITGVTPDINTSLAWTADGSSLLYTRNGTDLMLTPVDASSSPVTVYSAAPNPLSSPAVDPGTGAVYFELCADASCTTRGIYSATAQANSTPTLAMVDGTAPSVRVPDPLDTTTTTAVSSSTAVASGTVSATTTVVAASGSIDPTGSVTHYYCYSAITAPTSCDVATGTKITPDANIGSDGTADGSATATLSSWTPATGVGYYRFHATYNGSTRFNSSSESGTVLSVTVDDRAQCANPATDPFAGGSGTQLDPYRIATAAQLAAITATYDSCSFLQTADISLAGYRNWTPIGSWGSPYFQGSYDGGGYSITGLWVAGASSNRGLFAGLSKSASYRAVVQNLFVTGRVSGTSTLGGLAGTVGAGVTISNVHVDVDVIGTGGTVGGLVGQLSGSGASISGSSAYGDVSGTTSVGGLVGVTNGVGIANSFARGSVTGTDKVGGLLGGITSTTVTNSYGTGRVTGTTDVGGLSGDGGAGTNSITDSYWDTTTSQQATSTFGTGATTSEMTTLATFSGWSIASSWSSPMTSTWLICDGVNGGYPTLSARYSSDPCSGSVTVTGASLSMTADIRVPTMSFVSSPVILPSEWSTAPTCTVYDAGNTAVSGIVAVGSYDVRCAGGVLSPSRTISYSSGTLTTTTAGTGGRAVAALTGGDGAYIVTMQPDGTQMRRVRETTTTAPMPQVSPEGDRIAFIDTASDGTLEVFTMKMDGSNVVQMTSGAAVPETLAWAGNAILLIDIQGGGLQRVSIANPLSTATVTVPTASSLPIAIDTIVVNSENSGVLYSRTESTNFTAYDAPLNSSGVGSGGRLPSGSETNIKYPTYHPARNGSLFVKDDNTIVWRNSSSASVNVIQEAGKMIRWIDADPVNSTVYFELCDTNPCGSTVGSIYSAPIEASATKTLVLANATTPSISFDGDRSAPTLSLTPAVGNGVKNGAAVRVTATVTAPSGTTADPTGSIVFYSCYSTTAVPASCTFADSNRTKEGTVGLAAGTANDGISTATRDIVLNVVGWYRIVAVYEGTATSFGAEQSSIINADDRAQCADPSVDPFAGGKGTQLDPYLIATAEQLAAITRTYGQCSFKQTANLSLAAYSDWTPIGSWGPPYFYGAYNGDGYSISDMTVNVASNGGLFAGLGRPDSRYGGTYQNMYISGTVTGGDNLGGLAGFLSSPSSNITISNVHVDVDVTSTGSNVGGLVGRSSRGLINGSSAIGDVTARTSGTSNVGGLVGYLEYTNVNDSFARGAVSGVTNVGGLLGSGWFMFLNSSYSTGAVTGTSAVGGLVGNAFILTATAAYWDSATSGTTTSAAGTARTTTEMEASANYSGWSLATAWSSPMSSTWLLCSGVNNGYPVQSARYTADPCLTRAFTVTAASVSTTVDRGATQAITFTTSPATLPSEWTTLPTCAVYDSSNTVQTGALPAGTYSVRCSGGTLTRASSLSHSPGTLTVAAPGAGGRVVVSLSSGNRADVATMAPDGTALRRVRATTTGTPRPVVSPNGERIAFIDKATDGSLQVFTMDLEGTNVVQMTNGAQVPEGVAWVDNSVLLIDQVGGKLLRLAARNDPKELPSSTTTMNFVSVNAAGTSIVYRDTVSGTNYVYRATLTSTDISSATQLVSLGSAFSAIFSADDLSVLYVANNKEIKSRVLATGTETTIFTESDLNFNDGQYRAVVGGLALDRVTGRAFYHVCLQLPGCLAPLTKSTNLTGTISTTLIAENLTTASASTTPRVATTATTTVDDATLLTGDTVGGTTTVTAASGTTDPSGTVTYYYCYSERIAPTSCSSTTGTAITPDVALADDETDDGVVTATVSGWTPAEGVGFYWFHAEYSGDTAFRPASESGTNVTVAVDDRAVCADPSADPFAGGSGTFLDPYQIATAGQLAAISQTYELCVFRQTADISLAGYERWTPIGSWGSFKGVYDGDGLAITGLRVEGAIYGGLFYSLEGSGLQTRTAVRNLFVSGSVSGMLNAGGLAGRVDSGPVSISNVHVDVDVTASDGAVGGLVGRAETATFIERSSSTGDVTSGTSAVGGLVGMLIGSTVTDSFARGTVTAPSDVGGLVGVTMGAVIVDSYAAVVFDSTGTNVGGVVGYDTGRGGAVVVTTSYWDTTVAPATTDSLGIEATTADLISIATFGTDWDISATWSSGATWLICADVNDGYPTLTDRFAENPCDGIGPVTITAASYTVSADVPTRAVTFGTSPVTLPSDWDTEPTCGVYDDTDTLVSGLLAVGTYTTKCSGAAWTQAGTVTYVPGTITVTAAAAGGPLLVARPSGNIADIVVARLDGSNERRLATTRTATPSPVWSPNGQRIAFIDVVDSRREVFVMDADGTDVVQWTTSSSDPQASSLSWIDDETIRVVTESQELWVASGVGQYVAESGAPQYITDVATSRDGSRVAYIAGQPDPYSRYLFVVPTLGAAPVKISTQANTDRSPAFTGDGSTLVYVSGTSILARTLATGTTITLYTAPTGKGVQAVEVDPADDTVYFELCADPYCQSTADLFRVALVEASTASLVLAGAGAPSILAATSSVISAVSTASITYGGDVDVTITVTNLSAFDPDQSPTGSVSLGYCYDAATAPTTCTVASRTSISSAVLVASTTGAATATVADWVPAQGAGFYRFVADYAGDDLLVGSVDSGTAVNLAVAKAVATVTPDAQSVTYGDEVPTYGFQVIGLLGSDKLALLVGYEPPVCTSSYAPTTDVIASPLTISCSGGVSRDYTFTTTATASLTIAPATLTVVPDDLEVTYGSDEPEYTATVTGFVNDDGVDSADYTEPLCDSSYSTTSTVAASPLTISCSGGSFTNYTVVTTATGDLGVSPALLTVTPTERRVVYGDEEPASYPFGVEGFQNGETVSTASGYVAPTCDSLYQAGTPVSASPVAISCTGAAADNYTFETAAVGVIIRVATLTVTPSDVDVVYGDAEPSYPFLVTGFVNGETSSSTGYTPPVCDSSYTANTPVSVVTRTISCTGGSLTNYRFDRTATALVRIGKATLTVTPPSPLVAYGDAVPELEPTITGFVNGEDDTDLELLPTCTTTYTSSSAVSTYPVTCTGGSVANYIFDASESGTLTVAQAVLKVVPKKQVLTYGDAVPTYGYLLSGFRNGDDIDDLATLPLCTSTYTASTSVAASPLVIGCQAGVDETYSFEVTATAALSIGTKTLSVTPAPQSVTYGDAAPDYTFEVSGFVGSEDAESSTAYVAPECTSSYTGSTSVAASPVVISCTGGSATDYSFDVSAEADLTIVTRELTVTPDAKSVVYGGAVPSYTFTLAGFANGQDATVLTTGPSCTSSYSRTTSVASSPVSISCTTGVDEDYSFDVSATADLTVTKKTLTVTPSAKTVTYGDVAPSYTFLVSGFVNAQSGGTAAGYSAPSCTSTYAAGTSVALSGLDITCVAGSATDYDFDVTATADLTITKKALMVTPDLQSVTYGDVAPDYSFEVSGFVGSEDAESAAGFVGPECTSSYTGSTSVAASPVTISCTGGSATDYSFDVSADADLTIGKRELTVTPDVQSVTYGGAVPSYTFAMTGFANGQDETVLATAPSCTSSYTRTASVAASPLSISCLAGSDEDYSFDVSKTADLTITTKTLTVTPSAKTVTYGDLAPSYTFLVSGFVNAQSGGTAAGYTAPSCTSMYSSGTSVAASPVTISCTAGSATDYDFDVTATASLTVTQEQLVVTPKPQSVTYGDAVPTYTFEVSGFVGSEDAESATAYVAPECTSSYTGSTSVAASPILITCTAGSATDYGFDVSATADLTIEQKELSVTPDEQSVTYGDAVPDHTFDVSGFVNGETEGTATGYVAPSCTSTYSASTGVVRSPLSISCTAGSATDYSFDVSAVAELEIVRAGLVVTPAAKTLAYGDAPPIYTFSVAGFVNGQTVATAAGYLAPLCTSSYTASTPVSASPVTISCTGGSATNYDFDVQATSLLTIGQRQLVIVPDAQSVTYGDAVPDHTFSVTGFANGEGLSVLTEPPTCGSSYSASTSVAVSPLVIGCQAGVDETYTFDVTATASLTVAQKQLTVTPDVQSVTYGDVAPEYTFEVSGFVGSEDAESATAYVAPECNSPYTNATSVSGSPAVISCAGGSATDYSFDVSAEANLTIGKRELTVTPDVQSVTYGGAVPSYTFAVTGFATGEDASVLAAAPSCTSGYTRSTSVSVSPVSISCTTGVDEDYSFDVSKTADLTITTKTLTVTPSAKTVTYGDLAPSYTFMVSGFVNAQSGGTAAGYSAPSCTSTYAAGTSVSASGLDITCVAGSATDYDFDVTATADLTITKKALTVTPAAKTVTYGEAAPTYSFAVSGFVGAEDAASAIGYVAPSCTSGYASSTSVAASPVVISCTGGSATDYSFDVSGMADLTIGKKQLIVTPDPQSVTYGDAAPAYTFTVTGFVNGQVPGTATGYTPPSCSSAYTRSTSVTAPAPVISCGLGLATDYRFDTTATATVKVAKKTLTVTPAPLALQYGAPVPTYTPSVTGFVNTDDLTDLDAVPSCTSPYTPTTLVAASPLQITCTGGTDGDYGFDTTATAALTIAPAEVPVQPSVPATVNPDTPIQTLSVTLGGAAPAVSNESTAVVPAAVPSCTVGRQVTFTVTPAPVPAGPFVAVTDSTGTARSGSVQFMPGVSYSVTINVTPTSECAAQTLSNTLAVAGTPARSSSGSGTYNAGSNGTARVEQRVSSVSTTDRRTGTRTTVYSGSVTWELPGRWRLVGTVSSRLVTPRTGAPTGVAALVTMPCDTLQTPVNGSYVQPRVCGVINGSGTLQRWDPRANRGRGSWVTSTYGTVNFTAEVLDGGVTRTCTTGPRPRCTTTTQPDEFGLLLSKAGTAISDVPTPTTPVRISGGLTTLP